MAIKLDHERRQRAVQSLRRYLSENWEDEVGDLKASLLLDFWLEEIGPCVYNQAVLDAQAFFQERVGDLDGVCYEPEFGYWDERRE